MSCGESRGHEVQRWPSAGFSDAPTAVRTHGPSPAFHTFLSGFLPLWLEVASRWRHRGSLDLPQLPNRFRADLSQTRKTKPVSDASGSPLGLTVDALRHPVPRLYLQSQRRNMETCGVLRFTAAALKGFGSVGLKRNQLYLEPAPVRR